MKTGSFLVGVLACMAGCSHFQDRNYNKEKEDLSHSARLELRLRKTQRTIESLKDQNAALKSQLEQAQQGDTRLRLRVPLDQAQDSSIFNSLSKLENSQDLEKWLEFLILNKSNLDKGLAFKSSLAGARKANENKEYSSTLKFLQVAGEFSQKKSDKAEINYLKGQTYLKMGLLDLAKSQFEGTIVNNPRSLLSDQARLELKQLEFLNTESKERR